MTSRRFKIRFAAVISALIAALCALTLVACQKFNPKTDIPGINNNAVLEIKKNRLSFATNMTDLDFADIIARCECTLTDDEGHEVAVTKSMIDEGKIKYDRFELDTAGRNKQIAVSYKDASNIIFYDVTDYNVDLYAAAADERPWRSADVYAVFNDELELSVWVDLTENNYSTDASARATDGARAARFNGWYDEAGNSVTGRHALYATAGSEHLLNLHAEYLSEEEYSRLKLSYDGYGRRVFSGYTGENTDMLVVPEGVTYIDLEEIYNMSPDVTATGFAGLSVPSTAQLDLPLQQAVNTEGLTEIVVDDGNERYASCYGALYSKDKTTLYLMPVSAGAGDFPDEVTDFERFSCAYWQVSIFALPDSVTTLHEYCFAYSELMEVIGIDHVQNVMTGVLWGARVPTIEESGGFYTELNGKYSLTQVRKDVTSFTVKAGTVNIAGRAFGGCSKLESVDLGDELESIGANAFNGCSALTSVKIPATVNYIGEAAFRDCTALERVDGLEKARFSPNAETEYAVPAYLFYGCQALSNVKLPDKTDGIGGYAFYDCTALARVDLPDSVKTIGAGAFFQCGLSSVTLPSSLEDLGGSAFRKTNISSIDFSQSPKLNALSPRCFQESALISVTVSANIKTVPEYCFYNNSKLTSVTLEDVTQIDTYAFGQCTALSSLELGNSLTSIGARAFSRCDSLISVVLPDSVTSVGGYAFVCANMQSFSLGAGVVKFGVYEYDGDGANFGTVSPVLFQAYGLQTITVSENNKNFTVIDGALYGKSVCGKDYGEGGALYAVPPEINRSVLVLPKTTKVIAPYAFQYQKNIVEIVMNEGLQNIGKGAMYSSSSLNKFNIPATVTNIGANIMLDCANTMNIALSPENKSFTQKDGAIYGGATLIFASATSENVVIADGTAIVTSGAFMNNSVIKSVTIPDSVKTISSKAFSGCSALESISIGAGLSSFDADAFSSLRSLKTITVSADNAHFKVDNNILYGKDGKTLYLCAARNGLTDVDILPGVTSIAPWAFSYHTTLASAVLPEGVEYIGDYAFYECRGVTEIVGSQSLKTIGKHAFSFRDKLTDDSKETRYCNTLQTVTLYAAVEVIDDYAFYGQYGIKSLYLVMTEAQATELFAGGAHSVNITFLTRGCAIGNTGEYYNNEDGSGVVNYLYSKNKPSIDADGYGWFYFDENGDPVAWQS